MKLIQKINDIVSSVDGYKNQFIQNDLPNILLIDPQTSRFEFYSMILPAIVLQTEDLVNVAFTKMQKYKAGPKREQINLTDFEVQWADVIVFPFSISPYTNGENNHLFDEIREINPDCKIVLLHEVVSNASKFYFEVYRSYNQLNKTKLQKSDEKKLKNLLQKGIESNIKKSDKIIVPNSFIRDLVYSIDSSKQIEIIQPKNYTELIYEGLDQQKMDASKFCMMLDPNEIRVFVHFINDGNQKQQFIEMTKNCPENVIFYSCEKIHGSNHIYLPPMSIAHWYKTNFQKRFDLQVFVGDTNFYDKYSSYLEGNIIDALFMRTPSVFTNPKMVPENTEVEVCKIDEFSSKYLNVENMTFRKEINEKYFFLMANHTVNHFTIEFYKNVFLSF